MKIKLIPVFFLPIFLLASCSSVYYSAMEKIGHEKRDILVSRVKKAKDSQIEAKKEFQSALDIFIATTHYKGGDLEKTYRKLDGAYQSAEKQAGEVRSRNDDVEKVGKALFKEWQKEIKTFENADLKTKSAQQRSQALARFHSLLSTARRAEKSLDPVLREFHDHVLFLKHNLNARAVSSLEGRVNKTQIDVSRLIREMEASIREADTFIKQMK